jgi:hypothetical protein
MLDRRSREMTMSDKIVITGLSSNEIIGTIKLTSLGWRAQVEESGEVLVKVYGLEDRYDAFIALWDLMKGYCP